MRDLVAAVAQVATVPLDARANADRVVAAIEDAASEGAELVVLPELCNTGFVKTPDADFMAKFWAAAETPGGPFEQAVRHAAQAGHIHVVVGMAQRHPTLNGVIRNVALYVAPGGASYVRQKIHIPRYEKHYFAEGRDLSVVDTSLGAVGLLVCADNSFPEAARALALRGAEVIAVPYSAAEPVNPELYASLAVTRAYENQTYVLSANRVGEDHGSRFRGGSTIAAPDGAILARLDDSEGIALAKLDAGALTEERLRQTRFRDRRPHLYGVLTQEDLG